MNLRTIGIVLLLSIALPVLFIQCNSSKTHTRSISSFNEDWSFYLGDDSTAIGKNFHSNGWRPVLLPHDWSIELPFDSISPAGIGGGALSGGIGWYRKEFELPASDKDKKAFIDFDGVYCNSDVWINGHHLGKYPYGYSSFRYELTPYLKYGKEKNVIAVRVDNSQQPNSRWYSGSGIYRNVWLVTTGDLFVDHWGVHINTTDVSDQSATVNINAHLNNSRKVKNTVDIKATVYDDQNVAVNSATTTLQFDKDSLKEALIKIPVVNPKLWSVDNPHLYKAVVQVMKEGKVIDEYTTPFGIRYFSFDSTNGFSLNGKRMKINGVCMHHDLGCLGSAINTRAIERQLEILKNMGCNAIRTSHNPPAPELLDLCDKMGFIVMDEAFDMWKKAKRDYDYHLYWDEWHKRDLESMIKRDRNHPSVFMWSIGNEIPEQGDTTGTIIAKELAGIIKNLDSTRPIVSAMDRPTPGNFIYKSGSLDLVGFNYNHKSYKDFPVNFPGQKFIASESVSALQTRGHYDMPSDSIRRWPIQWDKPFTTGNKDNTCSAYDNCSAPWGSTHEETWKEIKKYDFLSGQFIWTGFDYIGEPTPYGWPSRSSYFGIVDLAGFPKDIYYMYQSEWTDKPVLHLFPHWNWKQGDTVDVWAYYNNADEVELFLNNQSLGVKKKVNDDLHISWRVPYTPGTLKAISRKEGKTVLEKEIHTAGEPAQIVMTADHSQISASGYDLSFITIEIKDNHNNLVPNASNLVNFKVTSNAEIAGVDNGCQTSLESFKANHRKAFNGKCLLIVRSKKGETGTIRVTATSESLSEATISLQCRKE